MTNSNNPNALPPWMNTGGNKPQPPNNPNPVHVTNMPGTFQPTGIPNLDGFVMPNPGKGIGFPQKGFNTNEIQTGPKIPTGIDRLKQD
jgi:hypothetical protein